MPGLHVLSLGAIPLEQETELSVEATVTVLPVATETYGAGVIDSECANIEKHCLGQPDGRGAVIFSGGYVTVRLADIVANCTQITIWAASRGPVAAQCSVHLSVDGTAWTMAAEWVCLDRVLTSYLAKGEFGPAAYLRVSVQRPLFWSQGVFSLDAVQVKGGVS